MGITQANISSFIEPESSGFIYDTARAFLKRHSNPDLLLGQLKSLIARGELGSCRDLIQLLIQEGHTLADHCEVYLLRAQIAFEQSENLSEALAWLKQAKLSKNQSVALGEWDKLLEALSQLKDGDYLGGEKTLEGLLDKDSVSIIAKYKLAHHLFWKNINIERARFMLEEISADRPEFVKAWSCLGFLYNRLGMKAEAQQAFSNCLEHETNPAKIEFYKQQLAS